MRLRYTRVAAINRLLAPYGLKAYDDGATPGLQLIASGGATELVADLEGLWQAAARIAGRPIDPLDARVLSDV
ncbi:hypothetical protein [Pseudogemmobacter hezensis]|uniref:hypothetical protein n=1 Tax=Pseudogemmobacter hezensis TaxID=2737662 RepID=UPI0020A6A98F|nr:hypothetical protein [Pseudogemmobacter hezensis]